MLLKIKSPQPKLILSQILNKHINTYPVTLSKDSIIIHEKDLDPIKKVYKQNYIKIKQVINWAK